MNNTIQGFSSQLRFTGLSGLDTETIISKLMMAERIPLDSLKQKRTVIEWKQEAYRDISSSLIGFKSKFFDIINRSSYMLSKNSITPMKAESSNSSFVTANATADAKPGVYNIKVKKLATSAKAESDGGISPKISGEVKIEELANLQGKKMVVTLDGVTKVVTLENFEYSEGLTEPELMEKLQQTLHRALDKAFGLKDKGDSKFIVNYDSKNLTIDTTEGVTKLMISDPNDGTSALSVLGIDNGATNRIDLRRTLESLSQDIPLNINEAGKVVFTINGKIIEADKNDTLKSVFEKINNDQILNVNIS
ncbi:MAG: hypothetical protein GX957_10095, partial [Clostridiaceae bacterium]|nr:hypothetical protein [Clostridiaceae bacterium]